jgi:hypothetical protein
MVRTLDTATEIWLILLLILLAFLFFTSNYRCNNNDSA